MFTTAFFGFEPVSADDGGHPEDAKQGHSNHGEAFNEGPRQAAYLMQGMANVDFKVTTTNKQAQAFFNQGVSQLHGFWFFEAERSFRQVLKLDPACTMAYWGMASANKSNKKRACGFIEQCKDNEEHLSPRERLWIKSLREYFKEDPKVDEKKRLRQLVRNIETIVQDFPDDLEAKAFLVVQIWENSQGNKVLIGSHMAVDALIASVLEKNPTHPIHHYRIHLWDYEKGKQALHAAAQCGPAAPGIAHMWHMSGHIYTKLKRFDDAAWHQEASARTDHAHMMRDRVLPDQIHNYAHNNEWLSRNLMHLGKVKQARALAMNMVELPRLPKFKEASKVKSPAVKGSQVSDALEIREWNAVRSSYAYGFKRLCEDLIQSEAWGEVRGLDRKGYFNSFGNLDMEIRRLHLLALSKIETGKPQQADRFITGLRKKQQQARRARYVAADEAEAKAKEEKKKPEEIEKAMLTALKNARRPVNRVDEMIAEIQFVQALQKGASPELLEDAKKLKGIPKLRQLSYQVACGDTNVYKALDDHAEKAEGQAINLALAAELYHRLGKLEKAKELMTSLRTVAGRGDLDLPAFERLAPLRKEMKLPEDWRLPAADKDDIAVRPPFDELGPLRWAPSEAPSWSLPASDGKTLSLESYSGKPVVVIFYLGAGCAHCIEQLSVFGPMYQTYKDAGIELVAISPDDVDGLSETFELLEDGDDFKFPIVSDDSLAQFKAYRAYDDFEDMPLHGTFLLDSEGKVRWQDISYNPFMHPDFLLEEAQRLLKLN